MSQIRVAHKEEPGENWAWCVVHDVGVTLAYAACPTCPDVTGRVCCWS